MWLLFVFAWVCFLALIAVVAQQGFGYDLGRISTHFLELPQGQRWAAGFIVVMAIALIGTSIFLSRRMSSSCSSISVASFWLCCNATFCSVSTSLCWSAVMASWGVLSTRCWTTPSK